MALLLYALRKFPKEVLYHKQRALVVILCVAVGVSSVAAVQIFGRSIINYYSSNIQAITGGDVVVVTRHISGYQLEYLEESDSFTYTITTVANQVGLNPQQRKTALLEIQGVDPKTYPLYGQVVLKHHDRLDDALKEGQAVVCVSAKDALQIDIGDEIWLGKDAYIVGDIILEQSTPRESGMFGSAMVPLRIDEVVNRDISTRILVRVSTPEQLDEVANSLKEVFPTASVRTYVDTFESFQESVSKVNDFVLIAAMISLLLGGLGVASAADVMMRQRMQELAIMKSVGGNTKQIILYFLVQVLLLGLVGTGLGIALGTVAAQLLPGIVSLLPIKPELSVSLPVVFVSAVLGLSVTLVFSLLPVIRGAYLRPMTILKDDDGSPEPKTKRLKYFAGIVLLAIFFSLVVSYLVSSLRMGMVFVFVMLLVTGVLWLLIKEILSLVSGLPIFWGRTGLLIKSSLHSKGRRLISSILVLALGLGAVSVVLFFQQNVIGLIEESLRDTKAYNIVLAGVPGEDVGSLVEFLDGSPDIDSHVAMSAAKGRIRTIGNIPMDLYAQEHQVPRSLVDHLSLVGVKPGDELMPLNIVEGRDLTDNDTNAVVVNQDLAQTLGLTLGDELVLELGSSTLRCQVVGLEQEGSGIRVGMDFGQSAYINKDTMGQFNVGLEHMVMARSIGSAQDAVNEIRLSFPNISLALDIGQLLDMLHRIFGTVTSFVQFLGLFSIVTGFVILAGTVLLYKMERRREMAVIRCLGGDTITLLIQYAVENGITGFLAVILGIGTANLVTLLLTNRVLSSHYRFDALFSFGVGVGVILLAVAIGLLSIMDVLKEKPLTILRNE
ncbi:MAG: ABC transporter permease [Limnochordia bacterium]|jgi:putative ABC transport system permease protein|nr:ABC transporter permease [Limnochordia bacterium]